MRTRSPNAPPASAPNSAHAKTAPTLPSAAAGPCGKPVPPRAVTGSCNRAARTARPESGRCVPAWVKHRRAPQGVASNNRAAVRPARSTPQRGTPSRHLGPERGPSSSTAACGTPRPGVTVPRASRHAKCPTYGFRRRALRVGTPRAAATAAAPTAPNTSCTTRRALSASARRARALTSTRRARAHQPPCCRANQLLKGPDPEHCGGRARERDHNRDHRHLSRRPRRNQQGRCELCMRRRLLPVLQTSPGTRPAASTKSAAQGALASNGSGPSTTRPDGGSRRRGHRLTQRLPGSPELRVHRQRARSHQARRNRQRATPAQAPHHTHYPVRNSLTFALPARYM